MKQISVIIIKTLDFKKNIWYNTDSTIDFAQRPETPSGLSFMYGEAD